MDEKEIGFVKLMRTDETFELTKNRTAFALLSVIALRAKRTEKFTIHNLKPRQALIGDYKSYGMTEKQYRTAKKNLEKWGFAAFKGTPKGTIATLLDERVYDINLELKGGLGGGQRADEGRTEGGRGATKKNVKKDKNGNNEKKKKKIAFSLETKIFSNITDSDLADWKKAYPAMDIPLAILQSAQWLLANPTKLKDNYRRFLTNWFKREQERGGNTKGQAGSKTKLFPIAGKACGEPGCPLPAVYKSQGGSYDHYSCYDHMPDKVKVKYAM